MQNFIRKVFFPLLQIWAYGAIAGLTVFLVLLIAIIYLTYSACRRAKMRHKSPQQQQSTYNTYGSYSSQRSTAKQRRAGSTSGSNVGVGLVVNGNNSGGSSYYGTGGQGLPPYYSTTPAPASLHSHSVPSTSAHSRSHSTATAPRYPPSMQSRTPSARSGFSFPDRYDSNDGFV